ncbi:MAG: hypothetical protein KVP17_005033 [Porospora cf. gigantea B]|uniref:uncharacterized protein n=1 Tax=Porospora cf. gigantea B TaxID=2853592 RepID=UPI003571DBCE|nr:MAG: hypothetical protein KVP17_005033 [Porospora cf. gigantea B]
MQDITQRTDLQENFSQHIGTWTLDDRYLSFLPIRGEESGLLAWIVSMTERFVQNLMGTLLDTGSQDELERKRKKSGASSVEEFIGDPR